jgi:hypothetical protein
MRVVVSQTGVGSSRPVPLDHKRNPFAVSLFVTVSGTVRYTIEHTANRVQAKDFDPSSAKWFAHPDLDGETGDADGTYFSPVEAVRLTVTEGDGTATLTVIQAGP